MPIPSALPPHFAKPDVVAEARADGALVVRAREPLRPYASSLSEHLDAWARRAPDRVLFAERAGEGLRRVTYGDTHVAIRSLAGVLLDLGASSVRPLMILSDNGVDHAWLTLAAMHVGVPAAPVSPAYALVARDKSKLRAIARELGPAVIYASDGDAYAAAIDALADVIAEDGARVVVSRAPRAGALLLADLLRTDPRREAVERAHRAVGPDTVAKILFTSGSTGAPKGVVNTQRMLCSNQQAIAQIWPFLETRPPVVVDWLPWSHTFGANHNVNMVLRNGGTLVIDDGKPAPALIEKTARNLREVSPTLYFNVPRGFDVLLPLLESDDELRASFFRDLDLVFYAAAALPQPLWTRLEAVARRAGRESLVMVSAWGSTETAPMATSVHFPIARAGVIGLPPPGTEIALVPEKGAGSGKRELRVKGPNVTPGYWSRGGEVRAAPRDDYGFLATGDAGKLDDERDPARGLVFDGRIAENFKLTSGTWVSVGALRVGVVAACAPLVQDAVVAGHDRDEVALLLFAKRADAAAIRDRLARWNDDNPGSSTRVARAIVLEEPPTIDHGEITDKGYVNQRAVLSRRADAVERLYAASPDPCVIVV